MFFDNNFVNLFEIGDYVKFRNIRGVVIEFSYPASSQPGYYKILKDLNANLKLKMSHTDVHDISDV